MAVWSLRSKRSEGKQIKDNRIEEKVSVMREPTLVGSKDYVSKIKQSQRKLNEKINFHNSRQK